MINFIILIGRKYFSNCVAQGNYWIIQIKLLTAVSGKNKIETKNCLLKHRRVGRFTFVGKWSDFAVRFVSKFFQCFKYT